MHACSRCDTPIPGVPGARCPHCDGHRPVNSHGAVALLGLSLVAAGMQACVSHYGIEVTAEDLDQDGYFDSVDCNDDDPDIHPDAVETADDGVDSNCDGEDNPQA